LQRKWTASKEGSMRFGGDQQLTKCRGAFHAIDDA
jgi:hypothetical protein